MQITWHGKLCFTIKGKETSIVIDPYKEGKHKLKESKADTVLLTNSYDDEEVKLVSGLEDAQKIAIPGEYEVKGAAIIAITEYNKDREEGSTSKGRILIYSFMIDDIRMCHLGNVGEALPDDVLEKIGDVDILMIPAAGEKNINSKKAHEIIEELDPRVVIPMNYSGDEIDGLLKEMGSAKPEEIDFYELKGKSELPVDKTDVVLLNESS